MLETFAKAFVYTLAAYAGVGLLFAVPFVWRGLLLAAMALLVSH